MVRFEKRVVAFCLAVAVFMAVWTAVAYSQTRDVETKVHASFVVLFLAGGNALVVPPRMFPTELHCEAEIQFFKPGGPMEAGVARKYGKEILGRVVECLTAEQATDEKYMERLIRSSVPREIRKEMTL